MKQNIVLLLQVQRQKQLFIAHTMIMYAKQSIVE